MPSKIRNAFLIIFLLYGCALIYFNRSFFAISVIIFAGLLSFLSNQAISRKKPILTLAFIIASIICLLLTGAVFYPATNLELYPAVGIVAFSALFGQKVGIFAALFSLVGLFITSGCLNTSLNPFGYLLTAVAYVVLAFIPGILSICAAKQRKKTTELELLLKYNTALAACNNPVQMAKITCTMLQEQFPLKTVILLQTNSGNMMSAYSSECGTYSSEVYIKELNAEMNVLVNLARTVARENKAVHIPDTSKSSLLSEAAKISMGRCSVMGVPIENMHKVIGVMILMTKTIREFIPEELQACWAISDMLGRALENLNLLNQLQEAALLDELTGLYNRRYFFQRFEEELIRAKRQKLCFSFAIFDLDLFKQINDSLGHQTGDAVLQKVAALLKDNIRQIDILARIGGEEFALILVGCGKEETYEIIQRIRKSISKYDFGINRAVTVSAGISVFPEHGENCKILFAKADTALYQAKKQKGNHVFLAS